MKKGALLYRYVTKTACTKCGSEDISDSFHRACPYDHVACSGHDCHSGDHCWQKVLGEHIRRYCRRCGHQWLCAPLDATQNPDSSKQEGE